MAAGLSLVPENFEAFRKRFDEVVAEILEHQRPQPEISIDAEINLDQLTPKNFRLLQQMGPFGPDNMKPVFVSRNLVNAKYTRPVGATASHLKLHIKQKDLSMEVDGIAFDYGHLCDSILAGTSFDMVYTVEENEWQGEIKMQVMVKEMKMLN